jgi:glucose/arabinose dehydrogenase
MTSADDERRIEELEQTITRLRRDLLTTRDALIGAQAEAATLKVRNRDIEVRVAQVEQRLAASTRITRVLERGANHRLTRGLVRRYRQVRGPVT